MNELTKLAIDAHGGLERWKRFTMLSAHRAPERSSAGPHTVALQAGG